MNPAHTLNTWKARTWAQVAQAVTWDDSALNSDGQVTVKATRGPVIVWGRRTGEGEDAPRLEAPTPSPLEVAAARVNLRQHIKVFTRGGVKAVNKWKSLKDLAWLMAARQFKAMSVCGMAKGVRICSISLREMRVIAGKCRRAQWKLGILEIYTGPIVFDDQEIFEAWWAISNHGHMPKRLESRCFEGLKRFEYRNALGSQDNYAESSKDWAYIQLFMWESTRQIIKRSKRRIHEAQVVLDAIREAFRAHLSRRVPPVSKRARVPRPLYARPRPPSCPLAPPVTC